MNKLAFAAALSATVLLTGCAGSPSAAPTITATVTATVTAAATTPTKKAAPTPTPAPVKTSGSYAADLAAAGTKPEDPDFFGDHMAKQLCRSSMDPNAVTNRFSDAVERSGMPGSEAGGSSPAVVRLSVAYFCPERAAAAEKELKALGYIQ